MKRETPNLLSVKCETAILFINILPPLPLPPSEKQEGFDQNKANSSLTSNCKTFREGLNGGVHLSVVG